MEKEKCTPKRGGFDYKWIIISVLFVMVLVCLGFCSSTKSLFVGPVTEELGIGRSIYSFVDTFRYVATAAVNVFFGALVSKFGARKLIGAGFLSLSLAMVLFALAENIILIYLGGLLLGIGFSWTTTTMVGYVVKAWCRENRGTIMGAALAANGIGGAVAIQAVTPIIAVAGYRIAYATIAAIVFAVGLISLILFRNSPKERTEAAEDAPPPEEKNKKRGAAWSGIAFETALKKPYFYGALICVFFAGMTLQGVTGVAAVHMQDSNMAQVFVSTVLSIHSLTLAASKFITGFIYDKLGLRTTVSLCMISGALTMVLLPQASASLFGMIVTSVAYCIFASLALPIETVMIPIIAGDLFGDRSFDKILGIVAAVNTAGYAVGAPLINLSYDIFGDYKLGMYIAAALMAISLIVLQFVISAAHRERRAA